MSTSSPPLPLLPRLDNHWKYSRTKTGFVRKAEYLIGETLQGRPKLICQGYTYVNQHQKYKNPSNRMRHWRCSQYNTCRAKAVMNENCDLILKGLHSHTPTERSIQKKHN